MLAKARGTVLILGSYPIVEPKHGGQVRLLNIKRAYQRAGWSVVALSVYPEESYAKSVAGANDVAFPSDSRYRFFNGKYINFITDLSSGIFAAADDGGFPQVLASVPSRVDVVHVEQPWLWPLASKLLQTQSCSSAVTIYGSQNIEAPLKQSIFDSYNVNEAQEVVNVIDALEKTAARDADLTVAVTEEELSCLAGWGAKKVLLLRNGIEPWCAEEGLLTEWRKRLPKHNWMLYVASAHPPNFSHFDEIFGGSLACFPPINKLVVAGSVSEYIYSVMSKTKWASLNLSRIELLFSLSDEDLGAVKSLAHGFVLPIPFGGGSNIKTAEALYSGAYVVGTPSAFRGYDQFVDLDEVRVGRDPSSFQRSIREVISLPRVKPLLPDSEGFEARQELRWDRCLSQLSVEVEQILSQKVSQ